MRREILSLLTLTCALPLGAQDARSASIADGRSSTVREPTLTLDAAVSLAERRALAVRGAELQASAARLRARGAWMRALPNVSAGLQSSVFSATTLTGEDDFGQPRRLDAPIRYRSSSSSQSLSASWTMLDGGRWWNEARGARAELQAAEAQVALELIRVREEVFRLYHEAVRARLVVTLQERAVEHAQRQREISERLFPLAIVDRSDVLGALAQEHAARRASAREKLARERADMLLVELLRVDTTATRSLDTTLATPIDPAEIEEHVQRAIAALDHPAISIAEARLAVAERRVRVAAAARWPQVSLAASMSRAISLSSNQALWQLWPGNRAYFVGLNVSLPFGGYLDARLSRRVLELAADGTRAEAERIRLRQHVAATQAWLRLREAWHRVQGARQELALQSERLEMSLFKYERGALSFPILESITEREVAARRELMEANVAFATARAALELDLGVSPGR